MIKNYFPLSKVMLLCVFIVTACHIQESEKIVPKKMIPNIKAKNPPRLFKTNLDGIRESANAHQGIPRAGVEYEVYVLAEDYLYAVDGRQMNPPSYQIIGSGWSGTEAATVWGNNLFAVQGGHLWKCDLVAETCIDLGPNWEGTVALVSDYLQYLYAIQGGKLWKVNPNTGAWSQLGNGNWSGSTEMSWGYSKFEGVKRLYIGKSGGRYRVNSSNGSSTQVGTKGTNPSVVGVGQLIGIDAQDGFLRRECLDTYECNWNVFLDVYPPENFNGASDITYFSYGSAWGGSYAGLYIVYNGLVHRIQRGYGTCQLEEDGYCLRYNNKNFGTLPIQNAYKVASMYGS